jgi:hypothetical protein
MCSGGGLMSSFANHGFTMILYYMFVWWRDVVREATFEGQNTSKLQLGFIV